LLVFKHVKNIFYSFSKILGIIIISCYTQTTLKRQELFNMCDKCKVCKKDKPEDAQKQNAEQPAGESMVIVKSK